MKAQRLGKLEQQRQSLERDFRDAQVEALKGCAGGRWCLFERNKGLLPAHLEARYLPESVARMDDLGEQVAQARVSLGYTELPELVRLRELRRAAHAGNALGEPRQAQVWLDEIAKGSDLIASPEGREGAVALSEHNPKD